MTAVVRLSNEDESGDPITPDSQTGADADRGGDAARTTCKVSQGHRGSRRLVRAGPVTGEWMRRGRYQNNRLGQILGSREKEESRGRALNHGGENGHRSLSSRSSSPSPDSSAYLGAQKKSSGERQRILPAAGMRREFS